LLGVNPADLLGSFASMATPDAAQQAGELVLEPLKEYLAETCPALLGGGKDALRQSLSNPETLVCLPGTSCSESSIAKLASIVMNLRLSLASFVHFCRTGPASVFRHQCAGVCTGRGPSRFRRYRLAFMRDCHV